MEAVNKLKTNPIFAMSLSSKELFHSNFWAWLFERDIAYARIFFPDIQDIAKVEREKGNRDVTIWQSIEKGKKSHIFEDAFIIENKFKSIPYMLQLQRYQEAIESPKTKDGKIKTKDIRRFCCGVLTGVEKPDFIDELDKWTFLSYDEIGKSIISVAECIETAGTFEYSLITRYGEMICDLHRLICDVLYETGAYWKPYHQELHALRINDIYAKLLAGNLTRYLKDNLSNFPDSEVNGYKLTVESYYGQNGAGIDIRYVDESSELTKIGVQIEGNQYRLCAEWKETTKTNQERREMLFQEQKKSGWFVHYDCTNDKKKICDHITGEMHQTGLTKEYGVYDSGYTFLYQYWKFDDAISFDKLFVMVLRDMKFAADLLKQKS